MAIEQAALSVSGINALYGDSHVLHEVSFTLNSGRVLALLGRNGAGKTTCMSSIVGFLPPREGEIRLFGESITRLAPEAISRKGIGFVPQGRRVFASLSVRENLEVARQSRAGVATPWTLDRVCDLFPRLRERLHQQAGSLSGGEQQMLAIARGMMSGPRLMILDEPSLGLAPLRVQELFRLISAIAEEGVSVLLVEQNVHQSLKIAPRGYVMEKGATVLGGTGQELLGNDYVRRAFLGR